MTDQPTGDFDGCNSECRKAGKHSLRWGGCEYATPPEPSVSMSVVYTDPTDGYPAIGFDTYTVPQLAELIEPALNATALRAWRKPSEVAAEVARAIVHRHDEERPAVPVSSPPPDQTALREAIDGALHRVLDSNLGKGAWTRLRAKAADAVLAVLPPPADQAAVDRQQIIEALYEARRPGLGSMTEADAVAHMADAVLRRLAAEAQQPEPESGCAHCGSSGHVWDSCEAYTALVRDEAPDAEPPAHIGGNADDCPACQAQGLHTIGHPYECPGPETAA